MRLVIENDAEGVAVHAAKYIVEQIKAFNPGPNKFYVLGLPTGLCILQYLYSCQSAILGWSL